MFYSSNKFAFLCLAASMLSVPNIVKASTDKLNVSGFIGLGFASTSDNNFLGTDVNKRTVVDAGIQLHYRISDNVSASGQIAYRRFGELATDEAPRIDFASLDFYTQLVGETQISVGRIKPSNSLHTATRDIPMSRSSILMPQSIYSDFFRNILLSFDGARFSTNFPMGSGSISAEAAVGLPTIDDNFDRSLFGDDAIGSWDEDIAKSFDLRFASDNLLISLSKYKTQHKYDSEPGSFLRSSIPGLLIPLPDWTLGVTTRTAGISYIYGANEFSAEYIQRKNRLEGFVQNTTSTSQGWYAQAVRSLTPSISGMLRYELFFRNREGRHGSNTPPFIYPRHSNRATTYSAGLTWQIEHNLQARAEVHYVEGGGWLSPFVAPSPDAFGKKHWTMFATQVTYRF